MEDIKTECSFVCHGCLSNDRQMSPLGGISDVYFSIIGNQKQCLAYSSNDIKLCWECIAKLKKFKMFQLQIQRAQDVLTQLVYGLVPLPEPLSKLTTASKTFYDYKFKHDSTRKKGKNKITKTDDIKKALNETEIKEEVISDDIENKTEIYEDENEMITNDDNEAVIYENGVENYVKNGDFMEIEIQNDNFSDDDVSPDLKEEPIKCEQNELKARKQKKGNNNDKWGSFCKLYTENATLVETKQINWGDIRSYFTTLYFDEKEMDQYIFVKERIYMDFNRYKFSCPICMLGYKSSLDWKRHNNLNHRKPDSPFKCSLCHTTVHSQMELETHWRDHTPIAKCNLCGLVLRPRGMKQHLNGAHTKQYACKCCRVTFGTIAAFGAHYRDNHMKFTCDYCNKNFKSKSRIANHIRNIHVPAFCAECNRPYLNRSQYMKHCVLMHPQLTKLQEISSEDCFCVECNKQYRSLAQYRKHLKVSIKHVEVKRQTTPCPECGKIFARKMYMKNHYNLYHLKKTKFYCELCDKYFARAFGLRVHNKHVHQKVQRVRDKICDLCGRAFSNNRTMLNHRLTHTGERPHKCPYCTAEFIQKYAMQTHMRTQHKHFM